VSHGRLGGGTLRFVSLAGIATAQGFRLPPGERWQWISLSAGPVSMRLRYGSTVSPFLEILPLPGLSAVHVHPGSEVYVEWVGATGDQVWVTISGGSTRAEVN